MSYSCPHCGSKLDREIVLPLMSSRRRRIYDAVAAAGKNGVPIENLLVAMYAEDEMPTQSGFGVMRVQICELNKILRSVKREIKGKNKSYYLIKRR